jgi:hypothetical protein
MSLTGEVGFEDYCLLNVKPPKNPKFGMRLEAVDCFCHPIKRVFAKPLCLAEKGEISPLGPVDLRVVRFHVSAPH